MDTNEQILQVIRAHILSYVALIKSLKKSDAIDIEALIERLSRWSELTSQPMTKEVLRGLTQAISDVEKSNSTLDKLLH